jgi:hypothetical protein
MLLHDDSNEPSDRSSQRGMLARTELPFLPKVRWGIWIPIIVFIVGMVAAYVISEKRRGQRMRAQLIAEHTMLTATLAPPYRDLRSKIERLALTAVGPWQGTYTAPGFTAQQLAGEPVLYGRVRLGEIHRLQDVEASIRHRYPDEIASCAGLETEQVNEAYRRGDFLMPSYVDGVRGISDGDRLAALRHDLHFRLERDTHDIVQWTRRKYLVLAVDEGAASISGPTRVYIWDLRTSQPMLRARGDAGTTMIVPIRIAGIPGGGRPVPQVGASATLAEHDCSVANVVREQLGIQTLSLHGAGAMEAEDHGEADAGSVGSTPTATATDAAAANPARDADAAPAH